MQLISLIWGISAMGLMLIGLVPCFGWLNWLTIPFAAVGIIISAVGMSSADRREESNTATAGLICCAVALVIGFFRLILGAGII